MTRRTYDQVVIDIQHYGQTGNYRNSRGAGADFDGDGVVAAWEQEAEMTPYYVHAAAAKLTDNDVRTYILPLSPSSYRGRAAHISQLHLQAVQTWVKACEKLAVPFAVPPEPRTFVVLAHLNAGPGDYGLTLYHVNRTADKAVAVAIAAELGRLPEIDRAVTRLATKTGDWKRAYFCLDMFWGADTNIHAALVEPWFMSNTKHQSLAGGDGPIRVGHAIADGILSCVRWCGEGSQ